MDLYAYAQIDDIDAIAKANNIEVPRLRGYRLMKDEDPIHIVESLNSSNYEVEAAEDVLESFWHPNCGWRECSWKTDLYKEYYLTWHKHEKGWTVYDSIRWERIHGKHRKMIKFAIKKAKKARIKQWSTFNKYVGRNDILMIHARIGGNNWNYYNGSDLEKQPWFIERVDDCFDNTYCDIYARIKEVPNEQTAQ